MSMNISKTNHESDYKSELIGISKGAGLTALGFVFMLIASFFTNALITRTLGADQYGLFVLATRVMDTLLLIAVFGFGTTLVRNLAHYQAKNELCHVKGIIMFSISSVFIISLVTAAVGWLSANYIAVQIFNRPELTSLIQILMVAIPFHALTTVFISSLNGLKQIRMTVLVSSFFNPTLMLILVGFAAIAGFNLDAMIWIIVFAGMGGLTVSFFLLNKHYLKTVRPLEPIINKRELWNYTTPLFFNQLFNRTMNLVPVFVMGFYLPNKEIGLFNVGFKIALLVSFSLGAFHLIFAPVMSGLFATNDKRMINRLYKTVTKWIFSVSLVVLLIIILYSKTLLGIFGHEFTHGVNILLILSFGEFVNAAVGQAGNLIIVSGRPQLALINSMAAAILVIILSLLLIPLYGATGAAVAVAASIALINIARVMELVFLEELHPFKISFFKPLIAALITGVAVFWLKESFIINAYLELIIGALITIALFAFINHLLKLDEEDSYILNHILKYFRK
jgi:O-antigen/teichoic acid export membrane protein